MSFYVFLLPRPANNRHERVYHYNPQEAMPKGFLEPIVGSEVADDIPNKENIDVRVQQW